MTAKNDHLMASMKLSGSFLVDSDGNVFTNKRADGPGPPGDWRRAEVKSGARGRLQVSCFTGNKRVYASRFVWFWFFGEIPCGMEVDHKDNDVTNNSPGNLQLMTRLQNQRKAEVDGLIRSSRRPSKKRKEAIKQWWKKPGVKAKMRQAQLKAWENRR